MIIAQQTGLSNVQKELLKLYASNVSDQELLEIRTLLSRYFAQKATDAMDKFFDEKGLNTDTILNWTEEYNRSEGSN
jgi:hypothetical protein